ncbi:hypothetical protein A2763_00120 [Candidatus Kaiserbacteria bacterium RIFCSPHIGHO2_01_FULL_54_36]|uniref:Uncharacterized protein n=1 Tax=Candidatus Kaiserbacteria bacterium RIFCSPHIGHO2_01_FULL_54_36 TaxID=1798482 RepID=A0A1F6CPG9_9BACT|nr:MAG: hypothetical protein A2763_00120 [Candidatus Kaiserbacteria bacterium RIFCSPHIGHO2_01_FULL_54_36]
MPEAHILEEVIIKKAKSLGRRPTGEAAPVAKKVPPPPPLPAQPSPIPPAPVPAKAASVIPVQPPARPAPAGMPAPQGTPVDISKPPVREAPALGSDIEKILAGVKLPERQAPSTEKRSPAEPTKFDTTLGTTAAEAIRAPGQAAPLQETVATPKDVPPVLTPQQAEQGASSVVAVHTLKNDLQGVVRDKKISVVKAVSLEEERRARRAASTPSTPATVQRSKRTFGVIFTVLLLFGLGAAAIFGVTTIMNQQQDQPPLDTSSSILFAEQSLLLSLDDQSPNDLKRALAAARSSPGTLGSIIRIIPVITAPLPDGSMQKRPATFQEFMSALGAHAPDDLLRAVGNDFFFGIHTVDENAPLLVIPLIAHDRAFQAMLQWEERLNADLSPGFTALSVLTTDGDGLPVKRSYQDLVMRNYDVRALKDDSGTIQLFYSFPTQNILIIAESPYSFTEIISRLQAGRNL